MTHLHQLIDESNCGLKITPVDSYSSRLNHLIYDKNGFLIGAGNVLKTLDNDDMFSFRDYYYPNEVRTRVLEENEGFFFCTSDSATFLCPVNVPFPAGRKICSANDLIKELSYLDSHRMRKIS